MKRIPLLFFLSLLAVGRESAQAHPRQIPGGASRVPSVTNVQPVQEQRGAGSIEGVVIDRATGEVLSSATVSAGTSVKAVTNSRGEFRLTNLGAGKYSLLVSLDGFMSPDYSLNGSRLQSNIVTIHADENVRQVQLQLMRLGAISGRITDSSGPVGSARVRLQRRGFDRSGQSVVTFLPPGIISGGKTDEKGEYRLHGVPPGEYYVAVDRGKTSPQTYYPGALWPELATPVSVVDAADLANIDVMLREEATFAIFVKLHSRTVPSKTPIAFVLRRQSTSRQEPIFSREFSFVEDGKYEVSGVPPGPYELTLSWVLPEGGGGLKSMALAVGDADLDYGTVELESVTVSGRLLYTEGQTSRVSGISLVPLSFGKGAIVVTRVAADGTFRFSAVSPGTYAVTPGVVGDTYLASVRVGGQDVLGTGLVVGITDVEFVEVKLDSPKGSVHGVVRNAKNEPVRNATVTLAPESKGLSNPNFSQVAFTDQAGEFSFDRVLPADYRIGAWESIPEDAHKNPDWLDSHQFGLRSVTVRKGESASWDIRLIPKTP
jgi:hypothetical protein